MAGFNKTHGITLPTSTIQGREFFWVVVDASVDITTNFDTIDSNFQKLVSALQQVAEMHIIGMPNGQNATFALSMNTTPGAGPYDNTSIPELETAINSVTGWEASVFDARLNGGNINWD